MTSGVCLPRNTAPALRIPPNSASGSATANSRCSAAIRFASGTEAARSSTRMMAPKIPASFCAAIFPARQKGEVGVSTALFRQSGAKLFVICDQKWDCAATSCFGLRQKIGGNPVRGRCLCQQSPAPLKGPAIMSIPTVPKKPAALLPPPRHCPAPTILATGTYGGSTIGERGYCLRPRQCGKFSENSGQSGSDQKQAG
jgi:hypothetical protein